MWLGISVIQTREQLDRVRARARLGPPDTVLQEPPGSHAARHLRRARSCGGALEREQSALFIALASEWFDRVEEYVSSGPVDR